MAAAIDSCVIAVLWVIVVVRIPTLWRGPTQRAVWLAFTSLAAIKLTALESVQLRLPGFPGIGSDLIGVVFTGSLLQFVTLITAREGETPRKVRFHLALTAAVAIAMVALTIASSSGIDPHSSARLSALSLAYWLVQDAYSGGAMVAAAAMFWRISRQTPTGALRVALWLIVISFTLASLDAVHFLVSTVAATFGAVLPSGLVENGVWVDLRDAGTVIGLIGGLIPATSWGRTRVRAARSALAVRPLWRRMRDAFPGVLAARLGVHDAQLRLYRRVIEIRDGLLALRPYLPDGAADDAATFLIGHGIPGPHPAALIEACCIELALHRRRAGEPALTTGNQWTAVGPDLSDEVPWMSDVSRHLRGDKPARFVAWYARTRRPSTQDEPARTPS